MLSAVLDNAPTYVAFLSAAMGKLALDVNAPADVAAFAGGTDWIYLQAISAASVLWGAVTYIGNGPNFMVKAMAERRGVAMPSFFGYVAWSGAILIPLFVAVTLVFFEG